MKVLDEGSDSDLQITPVYGELWSLSDKTDVFMEQDLLTLIHGRRGHFQLESGHHGDLWFQLESLCLDARKIQPFAARLAERLSQYNVEVVCGPFVEGAFIALLVSIELGCNFVYAERFANAKRQGLYPVEYHLPRPLQLAVQRKRVAIVNDVINAGSAVIGTFHDLQTLHADVVAIAALLAVGDSIAAFSAAHHVPLEVLQRLPNNLWTPSQCPLCAAGQPLEIVSTS